MQHGTHDPCHSASIRYNTSSLTRYSLGVSAARAQSLSTRDKSHNKLFKCSEIVQTLMQHGMRDPCHSASIGCNPSSLTQYSVEVSISMHRGHVRQYRYDTKVYRYFQIPATYQYRRCNHNNQYRDDDRPCTKRQR